ncbi:MAG: HAD family hydrolase [Ardenticatenaceae bacterium]|nr:HAD family hydrolase [Ardenticatenaceae bacterium]MCB8946232.1 HAD family hydrolase [Ardenticatenaceae bacterium]
MTRQIDAIVFDLDDTLIDWSEQTLSFGEVTRPHVGKVHAYLTAENHPLPDADTFFHEYRSTVRADWEAAQGVWSGVSFYNSLGKLFRALALDVARIDLEAVARAYDWQPTAGVRVFADTLDVLTAVKSSYKIGLITNSMLPMWMRDVELEAYGLIDFFDARTTSGDVGFMKPHTAVFHHLLHQLDVPPQRAVFVGDSPQHDIAGANATGMVSVLMSPPHLNRDLNGTVPDYTITCLQELLDILERLETGD